MEMENENGISTSKKTTRGGRIAKVVPTQVYERRDAEKGKTIRVVVAHPLAVTIKQKDPVQVTNARGKKFLCVREISPWITTIT